MPRRRVSPRPREEMEDDEERFSYLPRKLKNVPKERVFDSPQRGRLRGDPHYSPTRSGFSSDGISPSSITVNSTSSVLLPNRSGGEGVIEAMSGEHRTRNEETKTKEGAVATVALSRALNSRNDKGSIITNGNGSRTGSGDVVLGSGSTILTNCTTITTLRNNTQTSVRLATEISCQTNIAEECSRPLGDGSLATPIPVVQSSSSSGTPSDYTSTLGKGADADGRKNAVILKDTSSFGKPSIPLFSSLPPINSEEGLAGRFPLADSVAKNHKNTTSAADVGSEGSHPSSSSPSHSTPLASNDGCTTCDHALAQKKEDTLFVRSSPSTFSSPNSHYPSPLAVMSKSTTEGQWTAGGGRREEKEKLEMGSVSDDGARFFYSSPSPLRCSSTTNYHLESDAMDRESEKQTHRSGLDEPPESTSCPSSLIGSPRRSLQTPLPEHRKRSPSLSKGFKANKSRPPSSAPVDIAVKDNPLQDPHSMTNADVESSPTTAVVSTTSSSRQGLIERRAKFGVTSLVTLSMENLHEDDNSHAVCLTSPVASFRGWFQIRSSAGGRPPPMSSTVSSTRPAFRGMRGPAGPTLSTPVGLVEPASPTRGARGGAAGVHCGGTAHCPADTPDYSSGWSSSSEHTKTNRSAYGSAFVSGSQASHRTLKVVSYNILAQRFVSTDDYPTCPPSALTEEHRVPLLMKELRQAAADIIALSEISVRVFAGESSLSVGHFLHHTLHYDGFHVANTTVDGTVVHQAKPYYCPSCCIKKNSRSGTGNAEFGVVGIENALMPPSQPLSQLLTAFGHDVPASPSHHPSTRMRQDPVPSSSDDDTDGIAIFFNHRRFEVLEAQPVYFNRIGNADPSLTPAERKAYLVKTHNVGFALALHDLWNPSWIYIVGTSHLIWRSEGQLWQLHQLLKVMEKMKLKYQQKRVTSSSSATPVAFSNSSFTSTSFHSISSLTNATGVDKSVSLAESSSPISNSAGSSPYTSPLSRVQRQMTPPPTLPPLSPVTKDMVDKGPEMKKGNREEGLASQESGGGGGFAVTLVGSATRPGRSRGGATDGVNSSPQSTMAGVPSSAVKTSESSSGGSYYLPTTPNKKTSSSESPHVTGETMENTPTMMSASMKEAEGGPARSIAFIPMTPSGGTANSYHVACILTGDFNMEPYHAALDYARTGLLRSDAEVCKAWREGASSLRQSLPGVPDGTPPSPSVPASSTTSPTTIKVPNAFTSESTTRSSPSVAPYSAFSSRKIQPLSIASSGASASSGKLFTILPYSPCMYSPSVPTHKNAHTLPPTLSSPPCALPSRAAGAAEDGPILRLQRSASSSYRMNPSLSNTSSDMSDGKEHENSSIAVVPYPRRSPSLRTTLPSASSSHPYVSLPLQSQSSTVYRTFGAGTSRGHTPILPSSMPTASAALELTSDSSGHSNPKISSTTEMSDGSGSHPSLFPVAFPPSATAPHAQLSSNVQPTLSNSGVTPTLSSPSVGEQNSIASMNSRNTNSNVCSARNSLSPSFKAIAQGSARSFVSLTSPSNSVGNEAPPAAPTKHVRNETNRGKKVGTVKTIASHRGYRTHSREILVVESPKSQSEGKRTNLSSVGLFSSALENSPTKLDILSSVLGSVGRSTLPSDPSQTPYFPLSLNVPGCYYPTPSNRASLTAPPSHPSPESSPSPVGPLPCPTDASNGPDDDSTPFLPHFHRPHGYIHPISGRALRAASGKRENNKRRGSKKDGALTMLDASWNAPLSACLSEGNTEGLCRPFAKSARTTNANFSKSETSFIFQRCKSLTKSYIQTKPRGVVSFSPPSPPPLAENAPFPTSSSVVLPPPSELTFFTSTSPPVKGPEGKKRHSFDRTAMMAPMLSYLGTPNTSPSRERRRSSSSSNEAGLQGEEPRSTAYYRLSADKVENVEDKRKDDRPFPTESSSEDLADSTPRSVVEDLLCTARHTPSSDLAGTRMEEEGPPSPLHCTTGIPSDENGLNSTARTLLPLSSSVPHPLRVLPVFSVASRLDGLSLLSGPHASFELTGSLSSSDSGNSTKKNLLQRSLSGTIGSHNREMNEDKENEEEESAALCPLPLSSSSTAGGTGGKGGTDPFPPLIALEGGSKGRKDGSGGRKGEQQLGSMTVVSSASSRSAVPTLPYFFLSTSSSTSPCQKVHEGGHGSRNSSTSGSAAAPDPEREVTLPDLSKDEKGRIQNASTSSFNKSAGGFSAAFSGTTPPLLPPYPPPPLPPSAASLPFRPNERGRMLCVSNTPSASNDTQADVPHNTPEEEKEQNAMLMDCASPRPRRKKHTTLQQFATSSSSWMEEEERGSRESGGGVEPFAESPSYMMLQDPGSPAPRRKRVQPVPPSTSPEGSRGNTGNHALLALGSGNGVAGVSLGAKGGTLGERNALASPSQPSPASWGGGLSSPSLLNASGTHTPLSAEPRSHPSNPPSPHPLPSSLSLPSPPSVTQATLSSTRLYSSGEYSSDPPHTISSSSSTPHPVTAYATPGDRKAEGESGGKEKEERLSFSNRLGGGGGNKSGRVAISLNSHGHAIPKPMGDMMASATTSTAANMPCSGGGAKGNDLPDGESSSVFLCTPPHPIASHQLRFHNVYETYFSKFPNHVTSSSGVNEGKVIDYVLCDSVDLLVPESVVQLGEKTMSFPSWNCPSDHFMVGSIFSLQSPVAGAASSPSSFSKTSASSSPC